MEHRIRVVDEIFVKVVERLDSVRGSVLSLLWIETKMALYIVCARATARFVMDIGQDSARTECVVVGVVVECNLSLVGATKIERQTRQRRRQDSSSRDHERRTGNKRSDKSKRGGTR